MSARHAPLRALGGLRGLTQPTKRPLPGFQGSGGPALPQEALSRETGSRGPRRHPPLILAQRIAPWYLRPCPATAARPDAMRDVTPGQGNDGRGAR